MKQSTTIVDQINILKDRGMRLDIEEAKVKEILMDIGYFRLGFYCFPFEESYPKHKSRTHNYRPNSAISDVIKLYYLDVDLRNILSKYINRIEINFRTRVIYEVSNNYKDSITWFVDPVVMEMTYIDQFDSKVYTASFRRNPVIKNHHHKYTTDKYAPVWKTLEYLTFGGVNTVFRNLINKDLKADISKAYGINSIYTFERYIGSIVELRNACAHGRVLFDYTLSKSLGKGPALKVNEQNKNKLNSIIKVMLYMLDKISTNRANEMKIEIDELFNKFREDYVIKPIIEDCIFYKYEN